MSVAGCPLSGPPSIRPNVRENGGRPKAAGRADRAAPPPSPRPPAEEQTNEEARRYPIRDRAGRSPRPPPTRPDPDPPCLDPLSCRTGREAQRDLARSQSTPTSQRSWPPLSCPLRPPYTRARGCRPPTLPPAGAFLGGGCAALPAQRNIHACFRIVNLRFACEPALSIASSGPHHKLCDRVNEPASQRTTRTYCLI